MIKSLEKHKENLDRKFLIKKSFRYSELKRILTFYNVRQLILQNLDQIIAISIGKSLSCLRKLLLNQPILQKNLIQNLYLYIYPGKITIQSIKSIPLKKKSLKS